MKTLVTITIVALMTTLMACEGGSGDVEAFIEACLASSNLERPLCECTANKASEELSPEGFRFLVAGMSGAEEDEIAELRDQFSLPDAAAAGMFMARAPGQCAQEMGGS